jgi:quinol monooxygenase YgiN
MFGTVGRAHVKPENREKLVEVLKEQSTTSVRGFRNAYVMFPENRENEVILVAMFEDADSYWENADDPAQHQRYLQYRALMEDEPEWSDGEWHEAVSS